MFDVISVLRLLLCTLIPVYKTDNKTLTSIVCGMVQWESSAFWAFVLQSSPLKSSRMDTIPTSLLIACLYTFSKITHLAHLSFSEGRFPTWFKSVSLTPLLKADFLDKASPSSYRPISYLNFILKADIAAALVSRRPDSANSVLCGSPSRCLARL